MEKNKKEIISFEDSFRETFKIFSKGLGTLSAIQAIVIGIILGVIILFVIGIILMSLVMGLTASSFDNESGLFVFIMVVVILLAVLIFFIAVILPSILGQAALIHATDDAGNNLKKSVKRYFKLAWDIKWEMIGLSILTAVVVSVGFLMFVIPGIIFSILLLFAPYILVLEKRGVTESIKRSYNLIKDHFWNLLLRFFVIYLIFFVIATVGGFIPFLNIIINFFAGIFFVIYIYVHYKSVKSIREIK